MNQSDNQKTETTASTSVEAGLTRNGSISYLFLPAVDVHQSAVFYQQVFGWEIRGRDTDHPSFGDGSGHLSGTWATNQAISREPGLLPYIYVDRIDEILQQIETQGGEIIKVPYPEGSLWVATFRDPAGNVIGLWHEGAL